MEYIFQILCGMLYVFGLLFGWNYQETSVYVCIYAFPFLMLVPFVLTSARAFYIFLRGQRKTSTVLLLLLVIAATGCAFAGSLCYFHKFNIDGSVYDQYKYCMDWLYETAAHLHTSYEMLNIWIYVFGPLLSFVFLGLVNMGLTRAKRSKRSVNSRN